MSNEFIIGAIFFILGLIPAYYFYVKSLRYKEPVYSMKNNNMIRDFVSEIPNLRISYSNKKIKSFSVAKIIFFNRGSETITKQDIDTVNHLRIITANKDVKILDASIIQTNNPSSLFTVELKSNQAIFNFEYLDKNQGAVIIITHTGLSYKDIELEGDIKGVSNIDDARKISKFQHKVVSLIRNNRIRIMKVLKIFILIPAILIFAITILGIGFPQEYKLWMGILLTRTVFNVMDTIIALISVPLIYIAIILSNSLKLLPYR